jgi:hypothetical protein
MVQHALTHTLIKVRVITIFMHRNLAVPKAIKIPVLTNSTTLALGINPKEIFSEERNKITTHVYQLHHYL